MYRQRKFPTDLAGFALHLRLIHQRSAYVFNVSETSVAEMESQILDAMTTPDQLECLANNASQVRRLVGIPSISAFRFADLRVAYQNSTDVLDPDRESEKRSDEVRSNRRAVMPMHHCYSS